MRAAELFPGVALVPLTRAALAIGRSPKTLKNQYYAGKNDLGIVNAGGRLVVPVELLDDWLLKQYQAAGLHQLIDAKQLAAGHQAEPSAEPEPVVQKRGRGRPKKLIGSEK